MSAYIYQRGPVTGSGKMQINFHHRSKLGVTMQEASLSLLPLTPSLVTPAPNTSLHNNSGSRMEYYCERGGNNLMTVIFTHKNHTSCFNSFLTHSEPKTVARVKRRGGGGELAFSLIYIMTKCILLLPSCIFYCISYLLITSPFKPVHRMSSGSEMRETALYNVHRLWIIFDSFFNSSEDACFLVILQEERGSQRGLCLQQHWFLLSH